MFDFNSPIATLEWETFQENHSKFVETGNKAAGARARKALNGIKKLVTPYKKQSVIDCK